MSSAFDSPAYTSSMVVSVPAVMMLAKTHIDAISGCLGDGPEPGLASSCLGATDAASNLRGELNRR